MTSTKINPIGKLSDEQLLEGFKARFVSMAEGAEMLKLSQVFFRKLYAESIDTGDVNTYDLFGRVVISKSDVAIVQAKRDDYTAGRAQRREERELEKVGRAERKANKGPDLLDLRIEARDLGIPLSHKNRTQLIAAIEDKLLNPDADEKPPTTVATLREQLKASGLKTTGNKAELIARLDENAVE